MFSLTQKSIKFGLIKFNPGTTAQVSRMLSSLVRNLGFIDGQWTKSCDDKKFDVINPANMKVIAQVPDMNKDDCQRAIDAANDAFYSKEWHNTTAKERSNLLKVNIIENSFMADYQDSGGLRFFQTTQRTC